MELKKHFKLYKSGKQWVTAAVATIAFSAGVLTTSEVVHADTNTGDQQTEQVTQPSNSTTQDVKPVSKDASSDTKIVSDNKENNNQVGNTNVSVQNSSKDTKSILTGTNSVTQNYDHNDNGNYGYIDSANLNNNQLQVSGWSATNQNINKDNHFIIAYDSTSQQELGRTKVETPVARPDVKAVHNVYNAENSGFNVNVSLNFDKMNNYRDAIKIISRYSGVPDGNSDYVDFVSQPIIFDENNYAHLDDFSVQNGKLHVSGWNATNKAIQNPNHFLILFDRTINREVARQKVTAGINRPDVEKAYPQVINANISGFDAAFDITTLNPNDEYQILSRYSNDDNGEGSYVTYWFKPQRIAPANQFNSGHLDSFNISKAGKVTVSGWQATNLSNIQSNRFIILFDNTANHQIASTKITNTARPDVEKVYPQVLNATNSGYDVTFDLTQDQIAQLLPNHSYSIVSRYSADANGNGNDKQHTDFWSTPITLNKTASYIDSISLNGNELNVRGWMASDASATQANPYLIVLNNGKEVTRQKLTLVARPDVAKVYPDVYNSLDSGFNTTIKLTVPQLNELTGNMQVLLRYSTAADGNPINNGGFTDQYSKNYATNGGSFDFVKVDNNQVAFSGWHVSDQATDKPYQWIIVLANGKEVGRQLISSTTNGFVSYNRPDVYNVNPAISNSSTSGFQGIMTLKDNIKNANVQLVHRFSDDGQNGEGNRVDYWSEVMPVTNTFQKGTDQLMRNLVAKPNKNQLKIYNGNTLVKTLGPGTWENMAFAQDSSAINNINGYLSYTGWYRPYGTSQDGKTWYPTTVADWRPILMYVWPSKDVQVKFIQYFVNHGYENSNYGLTAGSVKDLSENTASIKLNEVAQNLRYVIEQHIVAAKSTSQLANDINNFITTIPELSASSELPYGQVIFVNNDNTSYADSKYRLMSRTINNQTGNDNDNSDNGYEFLTGIDIDNSNPVVQAENLNWEYFLLNYGKLMGYNPDGNFDGFRIDAADHIDADVLDQTGQLMDDMYHMKGNPQNANNHLSYNEGYRSSAARMLNKKGNPQLYMDYVGSTLGNVLGRANNRDTISNLITGSIVNRQNDVTENEATPNWSYVTNHDSRANLINGLISKDHPGAYKAEYANQAWQEFYADQKKTDKQYAQYNVPAQYAILLSNKDTVPQIYYGDLYNETAQYMQEKSIYYDAITTLMKARKQFVSGGQTMTKLSDNLIASVRYGKGVANANSEGTDSLSRTSGMAVIVGNNPQMAEQTISINMGRAHANEQYRNLLDTTDNGLTYNADGAENPETLTTDDNGILKVTVKGYSNPYVSGYLGVWVPVVSGNQDVTTNAATVSADSNKIFESNAALDSHMIYQDFSLYQPEPTSTENHAYNTIAQNAELFNNLGITDFWMAPPYTSYSESRYNDGYSVTDRYNLGTNANPTKYGSGEELANAIAALHSAGLKVQVDIVMNQMIGLPGQEAVTVTRADNRGIQTYVNGKTYANQMYFAYTTGGGNGQETYGGKYLSELQSKYPDLFTTRAISTGVAPDPTTRITKWSAKYENGTSLQNIGIGLAVKLPNGEYAYLRSSDNKLFNTLLPSEISAKFNN
ncbi:glycoside hydrolase family 70 protein [Limosilactobacillus reuteri]|uniref:glycoside hydrolase family 70 protein n=1 Tax=Limosilactobacillus reuteri TaxID=1598 RepID=UPI00128C0FDA|nr:glycoside hydrolase family 70 protein [Limosilactobacillus reuteri]MQB59596.1 dextransucrase [Limosilactobacillus reuteri]MQB83025.1 dextransucrase [Limosilactobacillus reuteri]